MSTFTINLLGCGSAKPSRLHMPSCTVLNARETLYMIDCGEGAQLQLQRMGLRMMRLGHIFLTHLHGDHVFGLPGLIGTMALLQRTSPLTIHTFAQGAEILRRICSAFFESLPFELIFDVIEPARAQIYENDVLSVRTLPLSHRVPCVGFIFEEKPRLPHIDRAACERHGVPIALFRSIKEGRDYVKSDGSLIPAKSLTLPATPSCSYAHMGDTSFRPDLAGEIGPVTMLYHEATYTDRFLADAKKRGHSTASQAAEMARLCRAGQLVLAHYSSRIKDEEELLAQARAIFPSTVLGSEGMRLPLD